MLRGRRLAVSASTLAVFAAAIGLPIPAAAAGPSPHRLSSPASALKTAPSLPTIHLSSAGSAPHQKPGSVTKSRADASGTPNTVTPNTIYVANPTNCLNKPETGNGTAANPYCSIQDAVNAAVPGDTISVASGGGANYSEATVKTSDISIVGAGDESWVFGSGGYQNPHVPLILDHVSHVTVSHMYLESPINSAIEIIGSSDVTIDSDAIQEFGLGSGGVVSVDGASSAVTVSRSRLSAGWDIGTVGISVAAGARNVDIASNVVSDIGGGGVVVANDTTVDVVGNTIQRSCGAAVTVAGAPSAVFVENNLLEDANPVTDASGVGDQSSCATGGHTWEADISVDAASAPGVVSDHNDFFSYGSDNTAPYTWAGSTYATLAAFQSATSQGAHDVIDTVEAAAIAMDLFGKVADALLRPGSAAIGAADESAPGALSDLYGYGPNPDCGAVAFADKHLIAQLAVESVSYLTVSVDGYRSTGIDGVSSYAFDWGDGTSTAASATETAGHEYQAAGTYTITLTVADVDGDKASATASVTVAPPDDHMVANISASYLGAMTIIVGDENSTGDDGVLSSTFAWGDGTSTVSQSKGSFSHTYSAPGVYDVTVTIKDKNLDTASASGTIPTLGSQYTAYGPTRLLDTRKGTGTAGSTAPVAPGGTITLTVGGVNGIPADAVAVALNLTVADQRAGGYITAYPAGLTRPTTSNVNFTTGAPTANMTIVPVGNTGGITFYNGSAGTVDLIADVSGYFSAHFAQGYTALAAPYRFLDTRSGAGGYPHPVVTAGAPVKLKIAGVDGVPAGVSAVVANLTVAGPTGGGYITAWPDGQPRPTASNINFTPGQIKANAAIVPVGQDGYIDIALTAPGGARLIADVAGYFSAGGTSWYVPVAPYRFVDTRKVTNGQLPSGYYYSFALASGLAFSERNITTFALNTTVTAPTAGGYLTVFPDGNSSTDPVTIPNVSTINFTAGQTIPNLTFAIPSYGDGSTDFYNGSAGSLQLVIDVYGFFSLA